MATQDDDLRIEQTRRAIATLGADVRGAAAAAKRVIDLDGSRGADEREVGAATRSTQDGGNAETPYEERTVDELRRLASDRDIAGRSSLNKDQLVVALRTADGDAPDDDYEDMGINELRHLAAERDVLRDSSMSKDEIIAALRI